MKRHHVELASAPWEGVWWVQARCRCGWRGDRRTGPGGSRAAERQAREHERAVADGRTRPVHGVGGVGRDEDDGP